MSNLRLVPPGGAPIDVPGDRALIGRDPGVDIVVNDPSVSRRHALVERRPEGWVIYDQRSANGTWVNDQRVDQVLLQNGFQLRLGAVIFSVVLPAGAAQPQPYPPQPYGAPPGYPPQAPPQYAPQAPPAYPAPGGPQYPQPGGPAPAYAPPVPPRPGYPPPGAAPAYPPQAPAAYPAGPPSAPAYPPAAPSYPQTIPPPASASVYPGAPAAPGFPQAPAAPAAPPRPAAAPQAAPAGGMSEAEAAEILGLWPGSPPDEVRRRYQKLYNDFQIRLTNAPTPSLKKMYQKNIQDLRMACDVICPGVSV